jgi:hypothetical protein
MAYGGTNSRTCQFICGLYNDAIVIIVLGGIVVIMLATGPKVRGFKPGRGR